MKNVAVGVIACFLLSACNQGQQQGYNQGSQRQAYVPSQQYNSQQQQQQQQPQQAAPVATPVAQAPSHLHADWAGDDWTDGEAAALVITPRKAGKYDIQMDLGEGYYLWDGSDSGKSIVATRGSERIELVATSPANQIREYETGWTECLSVKGLTTFCR